MKELEERISDILDTIECTHYGMDGRMDAERTITKEVKDIAIEFADYVNQQQTFFQLDRTPDQMFNDFIKERYGRL